MIASNSSAEDEQTIQTGATLDSSASFVLEFVHDEPFIAPNQPAAIEISSIDTPSSSTTIAPQPTTIPPPPTLL